jgi:branched-chain amino acid transport system ATP-binding protein
VTADALAATDALVADRLCKSFGALRVAQDLDFRLPVGARHALIGPNGAGKSTLINMLVGYLKPSSGRVLLGGDDVTMLAPEARVRRGLGRTFQINALFPALTPLEAVTLAVCQRQGIGGNFLRPLTRCGEAIDEAGALLADLGLAEDRRRPTNELAYGRQRVLEIALALAGRPKVLLLDEPAAGVAEEESGELYDAIAALPGDVAVLVIEHDMDLVFRFAQRISVMVAGQMLCEGTPAEISVDPEVRAVYLGEDDDDV